MPKPRDSFVKIVVTVPLSYADRVRRAIGEAGGGKFGRYDLCSFSVKGAGRFRGLADSRQFIGTRGRLAKVTEERIEVIAEKRRWKTVVAAIKKAHPYDEPAIDVYPLIYP